jgi:hypothetical protein
MLDGLASVKWQLEAQPSWNSPHEVEQAIRDLACATPESGSRAYSRMLYALGNNHAGTYFPVVLAVIPFLGEVLRDPECNSVARARALDVLVDLLGSFDPEPGFEFVATAAGPRPLKDLLKEGALGLNGDVEGLLAAPASPEEAKLANELLTLLRE